MKIIKDIEEIQISRETILNRSKLQAVRKFEGFQEGIKPRRITVYLVERIEAVGETLKEKLEGNARDQNNYCNH